ncbi:hypothetical protein ABK040_003716 [Willaertia magna]
MILSKNNNNKPSTSSIFTSNNNNATLHNKITERNTPNNHLIKSSSTSVLSSTSGSNQNPTIQSIGKPGVSTRRFNKYYDEEDANPFFPFDDEPENSRNSYSSKDSLGSNDSTNISTPNRQSKIKKNQSSLTNNNTNNNRKLSPKDEMVNEMYNYFTKRQVNPSSECRDSPRSSLLNAFFQNPTEQHGKPSEVKNINNNNKPIRKSNLTRENNNSGYLGEEDTLHSLFTSTLSSSWNAPETVNYFNYSAFNENTTPSKSSSKDNDLFEKKKVKKKIVVSSSDEEEDEESDSGERNKYYSSGDESDDEAEDNNSISKSYQPTTKFEQLKEKHKTKNWFRAKRHGYSTSEDENDSEEEEDSSEEEHETEEHYSEDDEKDTSNASSTTSSRRGFSETSTKNIEPSISSTTSYTNPSTSATNNSSVSNNVSNTSSDTSGIDKREMLMLFLLQHVSRQFNPDPNFFISMCKQLHTFGYLTDTRFLDPHFLKKSCKEFMQDVVEHWPITFEGGASNQYREEGQTIENGEDKGVDNSRRFGLTRSESYASFLSNNGHDFAAPCKQYHFPFTSLPLFDSLFYSPSRYRSDFHHKKRIGKGAFGTVFVSRHKIDGHHYALKKVKFAFRNANELEEVYNQVIREVRALAALDHQNIVRYNSAWFEPNRNGMHDDLNESNEEDESEKDEMETSEQDELFNSGSVHEEEDSQNHLKQLVAWNIDGFTYNNTGLHDTSPTIENIDETGNVIGSEEHCTLTFESSEDTNMRSSNYGSNMNIEYPTSPPINMSYLEYALQQKATPTPKKTMAIEHHPHQDIGSAVKNLFNEMFNQKNNKFEMVLFIQMQLCDPRTLEDWLWSPERTKDKTLNIEDGLNFFKQICDGIAHVHERGVIHRDLKPSNIFLSSDNIIKIGDFGLAKYCQETLSHSRAVAESHIKTTEEEIIETDCNIIVNRTNSYESTMIHEHTIGVGTYFYASPEQLSNSSYSEKADIFSLGIILFEILHPFGTRTERAHILSDLKKGIIPNEMVDKFPKEMEIVKQCIDNNPENRLTAKELLKKINVLIKNYKKESQSKTRKSRAKSLFVDTMRHHGTPLSQNDIVKEKNRIIEEQQREIEKLKQQVMSLQTVASRDTFETI